VTYSIDTSGILRGWRRSYPPSIFRTLWDDIALLISEGELRATDRVKAELKRKDDEVLEWCNGQAGFFLPLDDAIQVAASKVIESHPRLLDNRPGRSGADPFVIALAEIHGCTVVTDEAATNSTKRPNIPDVCVDLKIRCISLLELFTECGWKY
jgi:hypothetical protein